MTVNPYEPTTVDPGSSDRVLRGRARFWLRCTLCVLLPPAIYNYVEFDTVAIASSNLPSDLVILYRIVNVVAFVLGTSAIWLLGLPVLEKLAGWIRALSGSRVERTSWNAILYGSFPRAFFLAIPGAILWIVWTVAFYRMGANFMTISWLVGVPAHILAALWYAPLLYQWYVANRAAKAQ